MRAFYNSLLKTSSSTVVQKSLELNGTNQYMNIADDDSLSFGDSVSDSSFSFSTWIKMTSASAFRIMSKSSSLTNIEYNLSTTSGGQLYCILYDGNSLNRIDRRTIGSIGSLVDAWIFLVSTYDGSSVNGGIKLYIDSVREDNTTSPSGIYTAMHNTSASAKIGAIDTSSFSYASGKFYLPTFWNKELSLAEISEAEGLTDYSSHSAVANIISSWSFNDDNISGSTVSDLFGSNDGTLINSPTTSTDVPSI